MALTNKLKRIVDLPVWEWLRFCPYTTQHPSTLTTSGDGRHRYLYNLAQNSGGTINYMQRYDVWTDSWSLLTAPPVPTGANGAALQYKRYSGFYGKVLTPEAIGASTFHGPGLPGKSLKGYKVRIISGKGAGQERIITNVSEPKLADTLALATGGATGPQTTSQVQDATKTWAWNKYVGYSCRIVFGTGVGLSRKILFNNTNTLFTADWPAINLEPLWAGGLWSVTPSAAAGAQSVYQIEYYTYTVDSPWDAGQEPDATSRFCVISGTLWMLSSTSATPFFVWQCYDIVADTWYVKSAVGGYLTATLATDWSIERVGEWTGNYASGTATSGSAVTLVHTGANLSVDRYRNYRLRLTAGTGVGQSRRVAANTADTFTVTPPWDTNPDATTQYAIIADSDKFYFTGPLAGLFVYSVDNDMWQPSQAYDEGVCRTISAQKSGDVPVAISSITRAGTTATVTTAVNHQFKVDDVVTIRGVTGPSGADANLYNIAATVATVTAFTAFTYTMAGTPSGSATTTNLMTSTIVSDSFKNWTPGEHVGRLCLVSLFGNNGQCSGQIRRITANTATALTTNAFTATPINGTYRYAILDARALGAYCPTGVPASDGYGVFDATQTAVATLTAEAGKSWVINQFCGMIFRIIAGTGQGTELTINSNTANQLVLSAAATVDATSVYAILNIRQRGAGTQMDWVGNQDDADNKGKYLISIRGANTKDLDRYDLTTEQWTNLNPINFEAQTTGSMFCYDAKNRIYGTVTTSGRLFYYDILTNNCHAFGTIPHNMGTGTQGNRLEMVQTEDGLKFLYIMRHTGQEMWRTLINYFPEDVNLDDLIS